MIDWNYYLKKGKDGKLFYEGYRNFVMYDNGTEWLNHERIPLGKSEASFKLEKLNIAYRVMNFSASK